MTDSEMAAARFAQGWSCSQSVFSAYAARLGLAPELALRVAAPFGAGMARAGHTCGAVTGALMAIGLKLGHVTAEDTPAKEKTYQCAQEFMAAFKARHGSLECRELLGCDVSVPEELQAAREQGLFDTHCPVFVRDAAELVGELLGLARKPTREELLAARGRAVPDVIEPGLQVLFCGINPGLYSAAVGHHFARPGNRFWPALYGAGFTPRLLSPFEERELLPLGYGITNVVERATATASELEGKELEAGARRLAAKAKRFRPKFIAVLGIGAYRRAFRCPKAGLGLQSQLIGDSRVWVLPNPSGLNGHYQLERLVELFKELYRAKK
jgi:TDG/mug DNA glycosylase family protein